MEFSWHPIQEELQQLEKQLREAAGSLVPPNAQKKVESGSRRVSVTKLKRRQEQKKDYALSDEEEEIRSEAYEYNARSDRYREFLDIVHEAQKLVRHKVAVALDDREIKERIDALCTIFAMKARSFEKEFYIEEDPEEEKEHHITNRLEEILEKIERLLEPY